MITAICKLSVVGSTTFPCVRFSRCDGARLRAQRSVALDRDDSEAGVFAANIRLERTHFRKELLDRLHIDELKESSALGRRGTVQANDVGVTPIGVRKQCSSQDRTPQIGAIASQPRSRLASCGFRRTNLSKSPRSRSTSNVDTDRSGKGVRSKDRCDEPRLESDRRDLRLCRHLLSRCRGRELRGDRMAPCVGNPP